MNTQLSDSLSHNNIREFTQLARKQIAGKTLRDKVIDLVLAKQTTVTEAIRISNQFDEE
ncbi:MAG: hypothetical protein GQ569_15265 [Methylococcaceae bacterium]|nr:hypothetical protein [Methylococcaceae bacterium]